MPETLQAPLAYLYKPHPNLKPLLHQYYLVVNILSIPCSYFFKTDYYKINEKYKNQTILFLLSINLKSTVGSSFILFNDFPLGMTLFWMVNAELEKDLWVDVLSGR
jgi:hypothetical protein